MRTYYHPSREDIALPTVLYALSDPIRLEIFTWLAHGGEYSCDSMFRGLPRSTISHHYKVLREAGIVRKRTVGTQHLLSLRRDDLDALFPGLIDAVVGATAGTAVR
jgi:DNA-binding transcriptional ArsR family regulator